ncbi:MAG: GSCFA domain-containing protein [Paracoccaceae bacterium]
MTNPYASLPETAFWRSAVAERHMLDIAGLWVPKANLRPKDAVATYGSCFAQHIGRSLRDRGYRWLRTETAPKDLTAANGTKFGYELFSARTANIYTATLLRQWTSWATGDATPPDEMWREGDRWIDPFRPRIEPQGFASADELQRMRAHTIDCFRTSIAKCRFFVFTLGLTESWVHTRDGYEYPMCPGTAGGTYDPALHRFVNLDYDEIRTALLQSFKMMRKINPRIRFILTVSPVPLTATMSGQHVLPATMLSKSVLRAVAGNLADTQDTVDYFPSYEIINSPVFRGGFFEPNLRSVSPHGVGHVMNMFFACLNATFEAEKSAAPPPDPRPLGKAERNARRPARRVATKTEDEVCEEALLGAFGAQV